jgi:glycosyltransferase involved in cell wall biosynthesis
LLPNQLFLRYNGIEQNIKIKFQIFLSSVKILYIITQADGGGAQKYTLSLAKYFNGTIAAGSEAGELFDSAKKGGIATYPLKYLKRSINPFCDLMAIYEIRQLIKILRPDIVHLNSTKAGVLGSFAKFGLKTKLVYTAHGFVFNEPLPHALKMFYLALEKTASDFRDMIIAVSGADKNSALAYNLISKDKITTVHNGIGQIDFLQKNEAKQKLNLPFDKFLFVVVAGFYKTKGLDILADAASNLNEWTKNQCQFVLIGDGPEYKNLKSKIQNLKLDNTIKLLGKIDNARKYLKGFDCFILPSRKEGFPYVILEAMQAGLPVIAGDVGGIREALGDAGIIIPPENPAELCKAISGIMQNKKTAEELSIKSKQRSQIFTEEKMLEETKKVYLKLLN